DVEVFHPVVGLLAIDGELGDGEEEAPDEHVLLTAGDLDEQRFFLTGVVLPCLAPEADRARLVVDIELEIRIAAEEAADATLHLQLIEAAEEARVGIHAQETLAVVLEVVVPDE